MLAEGSSEIWTGCSGCVAHGGSPAAAGGGRGGGACPRADQQPKAARIAAHRLQPKSDHPDARPAATGVCLPACVPVGRPDGLPVCRSVGVSVCLTVSTVTFNAAQSPPSDEPAIEPNPDDDVARMFMRRKALLGPAIGLRRDVLAENLPQLDSTFSGA